MKDVGRRQRRSSAIRFCEEVRFVSVRSDRMDMVLQVDVPRPRCANMLQSERTVRALGVHLGSSSIFYNESDESV